MPDAASKPSMPTPVPLWRRRWFKIVLSVLGVLVVARAGVEVWGRSRMGALVRETGPQWNEARARLEALRHPWDPAASEPCAKAYAAAGVDLGDDSRIVGDAIKAPPRAKVSAGARSVVGARKAVIDAFLSASRCGSYAPKADEAWAPFERPFPIFSAARLVVLDARIRAEEGDLEGALDRLIAVAKAGTDVGEGTLVGTLIGGAMIAASLETLAPLVADGRIRGAERERVERALAALSPRMPTIQGGLAKERLFLRWAAQRMDGGADMTEMHALGGHEEEPPGWLSWLVPVRAIFADGAREHVAFLDHAEVLVVSERDHDALVAALERIEPKGVTARWSGAGLPANGVASQARNMCVPAAWRELTGAAITIAKAGAVPDALPEKIPDPCGTGDLAYARTTDGRYTLSSVGKDGEPGGDDLRVEPSVASPPSPAAAAGEAKLDERASLSFVQGGKAVRDVTLGEVLRDLRAETFTAYDPYYNREKTFRAVPLAEVVKKGFAGVTAPLPEQEYVLRARDGFTVPMRGAKLFEAGAYIAFADVDVPGWEPIGPQRANPGPFYLVWREKNQQSLETHPRPWQLASIEIARFEDVFPHTYPKGQPDRSAAVLGFAIFKEHCVHCHAINREGGRVGPELNVPKSIIEYRPAEQIKAYVRDPLSFRYGNMPAHPFLKDGDLQDLVSYFTAMKDLKHDPAGGQGKK
jgi:mono/diheme cytochrome c family protein